MTHLSLFSGIGGIDIAAHWAGFETIAFVEREPFCQLVLTKNFPGVPIHDDVTTFDAESFRGRVTLLSGGFPCQDISTAGKGAGLSGERSGLWFAMLDVISRVKPRFILAENVAALYSRGIDTVLSGLEEAGYTAEPFVVAASDMGAPHRRQRVFIVAELSNPNGIGCVDREHDILANQTGQYAQYDIGESRHSELGDSEVGETNRFRGRAPSALSLLGSADKYELGDTFSNQPERERIHRGLDGATGEGQAISEERQRVRDSIDETGSITELENALRQRSSSLHRPRSEDRAWAEDGRAIDAGASGDPQTVDPGEWGDSCISGCGGQSWRRSGTVTQDGHLQPEASHRVSDAQSEQGGRIQQSELFSDIGADGESQNVPNADSAGWGEQRWTVSGATPHTTAERGGVWRPESGMGGKFDGLSAGMDGCFRFPARPGEEQHEWEAPRTITSKLPDRAKRLKALGNAVVPAQVYPVLVAIAQRIHSKK